MSGFDFDKGGTFGGPARGCSESYAKLPDRPDWDGDLGIADRSRGPADLDPFRRTSYPYDLRSGSAARLPVAGEPAFGFPTARVLLGMRLCGR